ncbi:hypothetical protein EMIT074MI3_11985 [Bacillus licheniformis]
MFPFSCLKQKAKHWFHLSSSLYYSLMIANLIGIRKGENAVFISNFSIVTVICLIS